MTHMVEDELLHAYTGINKDLENPLIKILVSYIKPSYLFKTDVLTPIHLGRSVERENSKDGIVTDEEVKWLHENCLGDDDFEGNISSVNRRVGFLTGTYWAWKNYEKLGNPAYFGSFGYRRLLAPYFLGFLQDYDVVMPQPENHSLCLKEQMEICHGSKLFEVMYSAFKQIHSEDVDLFINYVNQKVIYLKEIYVMKKHIFFDFCEWIFPVLFHLLQIDASEYEISEQEFNVLLERRDETLEEYSKYKMRDIAFIIERLTGFYLYKIEQNSAYKCFMASVVEMDESIPSKREIEKLKKSLKLFKRHVDNINAKKRIDTNKVKENTEKINMVSVVINFKIYKKYVLDNPFIKNCSDITVSYFDNTEENIGVSKRYNQFLNAYDYSREESWFCFCHPDWEISDDIAEKVKQFDKDKIYGPVGAKIIQLKSGIIKEERGFIYESSRAGHENRVVMPLNNYMEFEEADTLDCLAMFVHSSLIKKYNLRFDENLNWDLYVEDFCIKAYRNFGIKTNTFYLESTHHSDAGFKSLPVSYYNSLDYLYTKYSDATYAGTCSFIGNRKVGLASYVDIKLNEFRKNVKK